MSTPSLIHTIPPFGSWCTVFRGLPINEDSRVTLSFFQTEPTGLADKHSITAVATLWFGKSSSQKDDQQIINPSRIFIQLAKTRQAVPIEFFTPEVQRATICATKSRQDFELVINPRDKRLTVIFLKHCLSKNDD